MDWSKAKNILILAFIITNIFLAYSLFMTEQDEVETEIEDELIVDVVKILEKENIKVDTEIPKEIPKLPVISLEYEKYETKEMLKRFLDDYENIDMIDKVYTDGKRTIRFEKNGKKIVYEDKFLTDKKNNEKISKEEAIKKSEEFIKNHGFNLKDAVLSFYLETDGVYRLKYSKIEDGVIVEETNMNLEVSSNGVISFERYWTRTIKKGNKLLITSSAPKSLLRLLTREEYHGRTIKKIDICYYFNIDEYKKSIDFKNSMGGLATPAWRFIFENGEKVFLEDN